MRMLTFYINRAGKNLPPKRLKVLENAKELLHERIAAARDKGKRSLPAKVRRSPRKMLRKSAEWLKTGIRPQFATELQPKPSTSGCLSPPIVREHPACGESRPGLSRYPTNP
jgi:hypothetical protein